MSRFPLPVHSYSLRSKPASSARLVNCYAEPLPPDAKSAALLTRAPGIAPWLTVGLGPIAGMHAALGQLFVVSGNELYKITTGKSVQLLGAIGVPGNIDMDSNHDSVVVVNQPLAYYWNGTFAQITDPQFTSQGAGDVEFINNILLFRAPGSGRVFGSDLGSASSYSALNFATAEGAPDNLVGLKVDHLQVIKFGETSIELWENNADAGSWPFQRLINGFIELGCENGRTIAKLDNSVFWLANDLTVRRLDGATPTRISTHAIEQAIGSCTLSSGKGFTFTQEGHLFYLLTFTEGTFLYDVITQLWHERQSYGQVAWNWGNPATFTGKILVGSTTSNVIGELSPTTYTDLGATQRMEWTYQTIYAENERAFHHRLEMVFEVGVGTSGQGVDPLVMLEYSDDGGQTWKALPSKRLGRTGEYRQRVIWHAMGSAPQRVYKGAISDPVTVALTDTFIDATGGRL